jgi:hypothetical protein
MVSNNLHASDSLKKLQNINSKFKNAKGNDLFSSNEFGK